ncbi:hypothetical protein [Mycolicibacterium sp. 050158]|jgi:hypothetical protein|uniref:hypothetical protein n=1 Tax=Mycolicibacterium sp. 050158 TaxID=3090602 RepID=UPI00299F48DD|nr:hypothetical protein [Mycolicibacterium sp. 050158]MDX1888383.1 hypothetical protein [Mycolicibacterium sp. 050158]
MIPALEEGATRCPQCDADLAYQLDVAEGGGLRYDVSCPPCGVVYYALTAPLFQLPMAA